MWSFLAYEFSLPIVANSTGIEYSSLKENNTENWLQLPHSIYGATICYMLIQHEKDMEYSAIKRDLEERQKKFYDPDVEKKIREINRVSFKNNAKSRMFL